MQIDNLFFISYPRHTRGNWMKETRIAQCNDDLTQGILILFFFFNIESLVYALKVLMQHLHVPKRLLQQMKNKSVWVLTYQVNRENCHRRRVGYYRNRIGGHRCFHCYSMMRPLDRAWMNCYRHRLRHLQSDCDEMKKNVDESTMMKTDLADDGGGGGDARGDFLYFLIQIIYY